MLILRWGVFGDDISRLRCGLAVRNPPGVDVHGIVDAVAAGVTNELLHPRGVLLAVSHVRPNLSVPSALVMNSQGNIISFTWFIASRT